MHHVGHRLAKLAFLAVISCALTACGNTDDKKIARAQEVIKDRLRDPDSAQFDCQWRTEHSPSEAERYPAGARLLKCYVRSKNGFGGYGEQVGYDFMFDEEASKVTILSSFWFDTRDNAWGDWRPLYAR